MDTARNAADAIIAAVVDGYDLEYILQLVQDDLRAPNELSRDALYAAIGLER